MQAQTTKLLSIVLIALGVGLLIWGFQMSGSAANEVSRSLTGSSTDAVMYRYIVGAVSVVAGLFLMFRRK